MSKPAVHEFSLFSGPRIPEQDDRIITIQRGNWKKQSRFLYHPQYKAEITYKQDLEENLDKKLTKTTYEMKKQHEKGRVSYSKIGSTPNLHPSGTKEKEDQAQKTTIQTVSNRLPTPHDR